MAEGRGEVLYSLMFQPDDNPQFHALRAAHQAQFGVSIAYLKERVGAGTEYANELARAVLSERGGYFELKEMPEEFGGALGDPLPYRLVAPGEARTLLEELEQLTVDVAEGTIPVRSMSLYLLYAGGSLRARQKMFVFDHANGSPPFAQGAWLPDVLPRFFKLRLDVDEGVSLPPGLSLRRGVLFFLAPVNRDDGRALLAQFSRTSATVDLGTRPTSTVRN